MVECERDGTTVLRRFVLVAALLSATVLLCARSGRAQDALSSTPVAAATVINQNITTNTTWTLAGSPYEVTAYVSVMPGVTLTIQPGVEVRFAQFMALQVRGTLRAVGTQAARIVFTGSTKQAGWWQGLLFQGQLTQPVSTSELDYVTVEYGGMVKGNLYLWGATVDIDHAIIRESATDGIFADTRGLPNIANTAFVNNGVGASHFPLRLSDGSLNPTLRSLTFLNNGENVIAIVGGTLQGDHVWEAVGAPYVLLAEVNVAIDSSLTIEPGVEIRFAPEMALRVMGRLIAVGQKNAPIVFTGTEPLPGWWEGLIFLGDGARPGVGSILRYTIIEYGGSPKANLYLFYAAVSISDTIIRYSAKDGLFADVGSAGTTIESSQIVNIAGYGVKSISNNAVLMAANNWWGSSSGPAVDQNCNAGGSGSLVSVNVEYRPFMTAADASVLSVAAPASYSIAITPLRWFLPADGVTRGDILLTLRDGEGNPIAGRRVHVSSTLGTVQSGGITDFNGQTRARIVSGQPGTATLSASVDSAGPCDVPARSGTAEIAFTSYTPGSLTPNAAAPYMDDALLFSPEPIVKDVPTTITALVVNPNPFPISVNGNFGILQSGIGLAFPPVGSVEQFEIAANDTGRITVNWTPPISGHYCVVFDYTWQGTGSAEAASISAEGRSQKNLNVYGGSPDTKSDKDILKKAANSMALIKKVGGKGNKAGFITNAGADYLTEWQLSKAAQISQAMGGDPSRQDYTIVAQANPVLLPPVQAGPGLTPDMATALNALRTALSYANAHGDAFIISYDRYGGASAANDMAWASQQTVAMIDQKHDMAMRLLDAADALDAYVAARQVAGIADVELTVAEIETYQQQLATTGFSEDEIAAARAVGMSDAAIEAARLQTVAADADAQGGGFVAKLGEIASSLGALGFNVLYPPTFGGQVVGGGHGYAAAVRTDFAPAVVIPPMPEVPDTINLARVYEVVDTIQVGNPTGQTALVDLSARPIDLPAGWMVSLTPSSLTLAAGAAAPVTVRITPGGPAVQGTTALVAVEGYVGSQLIGGVTMRVLVPANPFKPGGPVFLPVVARP